MTRSPALSRVRTHNAREMVALPLALRPCRAAATSSGSTGRNRPCDGRAGLRRDQGFWRHQRPRATGGATPSGTVRTRRHAARYDRVETRREHDSHSKCGPSRDRTGHMKTRGHRLIGDATATTPGLSRVRHRDASPQAGNPGGISVRNGDSPSSVSMRRRFVPRYLVVALVFLAGACASTDRADGLARFS